MHIARNRGRLLPLHVLVIFSFLHACGGGDSQSSDGGVDVDPSGATGEMPVLLDAPPLTVNAGGYYTYTPSYVYGMPDAVTFSIRKKPDWAFFRPKTGQLFGSPRIPHMGTAETVIITINTPDGSLPIGPFDITVEAPLNLPEPTPPEQEPAPKPAPPQVSKPGPGPTLKRVQYRGHYISSNPWDTRQNKFDALRQGVQGLQIRYTWASLEPRYGEYDFSAVEADLDLLESKGKRLVVFIEDKSFNADIPTPAYLASLTARNRKGGYTAVRWKPFVVQRLKLLIDELGKRYDGHPAFEGVALQESEPGFNDYVLSEYDYTPEIYRDATIEQLLSAAESVPTSTVFWYMNFFPNKMAYIGQIAEAVAPAGVAMGGPDVLPDSASLVRLTYPLYDQFKNKMVLFNSLQYNSYNHVRKNKKYGSKYWNMPQLYRYARDELHVSYLFWNRKTRSAPKDSYMWKDALPVIKANGVIRPSWRLKQATKQP